MKTGQNILVAEGRDVGSVVFSKARAKFFLTASPEARERRYTERATAPLSIPDGAIYLDHVKAALSQ